MTDDGQEGRIIERRETRYSPKVRSAKWLKVKRFTECDAVAVGYTAGEGNRAGTLGSLVITDGDRCIGRAGTGFTETELTAITASFEPVDDVQPVAGPGGDAR